MKEIGCHRGLRDPGQPAVEPDLGGQPRAARAFAGLLFIASVVVVHSWPRGLLARLGAPRIVRWPLASAGLWLGISHLVAAAMGYRGCPEVGAIASLILRRRVTTTCSPWERLDQRLARRERPA